MGDAINNTLKLRDIHLPGSPGFWPLAPGWWLLLVLILLATSWLLFKLLRRMTEKKRQQQIISQYSALETRLIKNPDNKAIANINTFLRQLAINKYPRSDIASLTGVKWLHFLDESGNTHEFTQGAGRILEDAPYQSVHQSGELQNLNIAELAPLLRSWVKKVVKKGGVGI